MEKSKQNKKFSVLLVSVLVLALVFSGFALYKLSIPKESSVLESKLGIVDVNFLRTTSANMSSSTIDSSSLNTIFSANGGRTYAIICNEGSNTVYLNFSSATATVSVGIFLSSSGGCYEILPENLYRGAITGITLSGTSSVTTIEFR